MKCYLLQADLLGSITPQFFLWYILWAFIGAGTMLVTGTAFRDPNSQWSPKKWSLWYLLKDNYKRIFLNIFLILLTLLFFKDITGIELNKWWAFCVGFSFDSILLLIKQKTAFLDPRKNETPSEPNVPSNLNGQENKGG